MLKFIQFQKNLKNFKIKKGQNFQKISKSNELKKCPNL